MPDETGTCVVPATAQRHAGEEGIFLPSIRQHGPSTFRCSGAAFDLAVDCDEARGSDDIPSPVSPREPLPVRISVLLW